MTNEQQPASNRPEWLPDKFKTPEDMVKSYHAAERKISELTKSSPTSVPAARDSVSGQVSATIKDSQETPPVPDDHSEAGQTTPDDGSELPELELDPTKAPTVDPEKDRSEVAEAVRRATEGNLDPETIERLERAGISRETLSAIQQRMAEGQRALAQLHAAEMTKTIGGVEVFNEVRRWAAHELPPDEIAALDAQLTSPNAALVRRAVEMVHAQWRKAQGPTLIEGMPPSNRSIGYSSQAEQVRAMSDPRYKTDPAYREEVTRRSMAMR